MEAGMTKYVAFVVAMVLCTASFPAHVHADDNSHRAAVLELFTLMDMRAALAQNTEAVLRSQIEGNPALASFAPKLRMFFARYLGWDALKDELVGIYLRAFTEDEVQQLVAFYKSPVGRKALLQMPQLMAQTETIGLARVQEHMADLMTMLQEPTPQPH